jgi:hypothetical protein
VPVILPQPGAADLADSLLIFLVEPHETLPEINQIIKLPREIKRPF